MIPVRQVRASRRPPCESATLRATRGGDAYTHLLLATTLALTALLPAHAAPQDDWAKGRLLVMARAGLSAEALGKILQPHGGHASRLGQSNLHIVKLPANASETAVLAKLAHNPHLKFAELDRRLSIAVAVNDPYVGSEWHLAKINAAKAWDTSQGVGLTIAILDTGVLPTHPDLSQVPGWNFVDNNSNTADVHGHGTMVAGAAAAMANNTIGVAGVAGGARIMPIRVADATGYAYYSTIASGITYAADQGVRVANVSIDGAYSSASVQSAGQYLKGKGGLLVVGAGNSNANTGTLALTSMIPVAATDSNDAKASFSNYGGYVALAAPGVGIWTTNKSGGYSSASGTSMASPVVAGAAALVMAANPALSSSQVESVLFSAALDLGAAGRDIYFGHGRVDAAAAVAAAAVAVGADTQAPTVAISAPLGSSSVSAMVPVDAQAADNVGVVRVDLQVNGNTVASDTASPFQFSWDSTGTANGMATLVAVAYDAAGNSAASTQVLVNVANSVAADTIAPVVSIRNPVAGSKVSGTVGVSTSATDNAGTAAIKQSLYLDGKLVASSTGGSLSYSWNTRKAAAGSHTLTAVGQDAAGNKTSVSVSVIR